MLQLELKVPTADLLRLAGNVEPAKRAGLKRVVDHAQGIAVRKAVAIRRRRVPTRREVALYRQRKRKSKRKKRAITASDAPAWKPSGDLVRSIEAEPVFESDDVVALTADVLYAEDRHELGVSRIPKDPALGIVRKDSFFADTARSIEPQIDELFREGFESEFYK